MSATTGQRQKSHREHRPGGRRLPISLLCDDIHDPKNIGSLFRLADALGLAHIHLCGHSPCPPHAKIRKTARACEQHVAWSHTDDAPALAQQLKTEGCLLLALEISNHSLPLHDPRIGEAIRHRDMVLMLGAEKHGLSHALLQQADLSLHIPMQGRNSSMNVAMAAAIAVYELGRVLATEG